MGGKERFIISLVFNGKIMKKINIELKILTMIVILTKNKLKIIWRRFQMRV